MNSTAPFIGQLLNFFLFHKMILNMCTKMKSQVIMTSGSFFTTVWMCNCNQNHPACKHTYRSVTPWDHFMLKTLIFLTQLFGTWPSGTSPQLLFQFCLLRERAEESNIVRMVKWPPMDIYNKTFSKLSPGNINYILSWFYITDILCACEFSTSMWLWDRKEKFAFGRIILFFNVLIKCSR